MITHPATTTSSGSLERRLCYTLVAETLRSARGVLVEVKAVRFIADYPWKIGKQLRPVMFLLCVRNMRLEKGIELESDQRDASLAAAIELLHEASLVHDDLVDRSELRRGVPTVHMHAGQGMALLVGDYMVFRGLKMILDSARSARDLVIAQQLAETGLAIAHGEAEQLDRFLRQNTLASRMSRDSYMDIIAKKTAAFFAGCAEGGAAAGGADERQRRVYREFGMSLGMAFQMVDDLIDIYGDSERAQKTLRNDIDEGTITLPMIHAFQLFPQHEAWRGMSGRGDRIGGACAGVMELLQDPRVRRLSEQAALASMTEAREWLKQMPRNIYRMGLADLLEFVSTCPWGGLDLEPRGDLALASGG